VGKLGFPLSSNELQIVIGVGHLLIWRSIANLQVQNFLRCLIEQVVGVSGSSLEAGTHAWGQSYSPLIGVQCGVACDDVDELVLLCVRVAQRGNGIGSEARQIDAEVLKAKELAELTLLPAVHARAERFRIEGDRRTGRYVNSADRDWRQGG